MATSLVELLPLLTRLSESRDVATTLGELAQASGESPSHFQRSFARLVGESPKQLDLRLRLELAAARLVASDASILGSRSRSASTATRALAGRSAACSGRARGRFARPSSSTKRPASATRRC